MEQKIIKIDCDGVLRDLLFKMCEVYNNHYNTNLQPHEVTEFDVSKIFTKCEEVDNIPANTWLFKQNGYELFFNSPMMDGAKEAMDMLHELGYYIVIVTHQQTLENNYSCASHPAYPHKRSNHLFPLMLYGTHQQYSYEPL